MADVVVALCDGRELRGVPDTHFDIMEVDSMPPSVSYSQPCMADWGHLPLDLLEMIVSNVEQFSHPQISLVNKHWCKGVSKAMRSLTPKGDVSVHELTTAIPKRFSNVTSLRLSHIKNDVTDAGLSVLNSLTNLTSLNLCWCSKISDKGLGAVGRMPNLATLNLALCKKITDNGLGALLWLTGLQSLTLRGCCEVTNEGVQMLAKLPMLTHLDLWGCKEVSEEGLGALTRSSSLKFLNLKGCTRVNPKAIHAIGHATNLTYLNLSGCWNITNDCLNSLVLLTNLRTLFLESCSISDNGIELLASIPSLTSLSLGGNDQITNQGLGFLAGLPGLTSLDLHGCRHGLTEEGLIALQPLSNLTHLDISDNNRVTVDTTQLHTMLPSLVQFWA